MSDCLHCDINELVQKHLEPVNADLGELVARMAESLVDTILLAPENERANLMAEVVAALGHLYLEKAAQSNLNLVRGISRSSFARGGCYG